MGKGILLVGMGGALGSICRYLVGLACAGLGWSRFPLHTFIVNFVGSILIGFFAVSFAKELPLHGPLKLLLITGFCGGFTTFSAFAAEFYGLYEEKAFWSAMVYIGLSLIFGFIGVGLGMFLAGFNGK